jgi:hypothetical protein
MLFFIMKILFNTHIHYIKRFIFFKPQQSYAGIIFYLKVIKAEDGRKEQKRIVFRRHLVRS